jgi:Predicted transcriptional regulator
MRKISYNKLWKLLIDKDWTKSDLCQQASVSPASLSKLKHGTNITTDVLLRICESLDCNLEDIMETVIDKENK